MAFNGSGTHNLPHDWTTDLTNAIPVTASRMDTQDTDISTALSNTICRDGQSTTTARIPFAAGLSAAAGTTASVSYAQTNDNNTGLYFPATDQWGLVAGGVSVLAASATVVACNVALGVTGVATFSSAASVAGDFAINTNKFTVTASSGNTLVAGTLAVTGAATLSSTLAAGATTITGALAASGDFAIATNKFTVASASGNTVAAGTLAVTGDVAVNTNKFTVAAASGNTLVAGTLAVTGAQTNTGALAANNSAGITGRNTIKAFGKVIDGTLQAGFNVASITDNGTSHTVTFTNAMANTNYAVLLTCDRDNTSSGHLFVLTYHTVAAGSFRIEGAVSGVSNNLDPDSYSFMVLSNE